MSGISNSTTPNYAPHQAVAQVQPIENTKVINEKQAVIQPKNESKIAGNGKPLENTKTTKLEAPDKKETKGVHNIRSTSFAKVSVNAISLQEIS